MRKLLKMKMKKERNFNGQVMETGLECTGGLDWTGFSTHVNMGFVDLNVLSWKLH